MHEDSSADDLNWMHVNDRAWTSRDTARYVEGAHNAVHIWFGRDVLKQFSLGFLSKLTGLAGLSLDGPLSNDLAVFDVGTLVDLSLVTSCKKPPLLERVPTLRSLALCERQGLDHVGQGCRFSSGPRAAPVPCEASGA